MNRPHFRSSIMGRNFVPVIIAFNIVLFSASLVLGARCAWRRDWEKIAVWMVLIVVAIMNISFILTTLTEKIAN